MRHITMPFFPALSVGPWPLPGGAVAIPGAPSADRAASREEAREQWRRRARLATWILFNALRVAIFLSIVLWPWQTAR